MSEKLNENLITYTRDTLLFTVKSICNMHFKCQMDCI